LGEKKSVEQTKRKNKIKRIITKKTLFVVNKYNRDPKNAK
jgi:hypothetical protein